MDGKVFNSEGQYVANIRVNEIYDLSGRKLYDLRGQKIYKPTGELVGHLNSTGLDRRLDKSTDRFVSICRVLQHRSNRICFWAARAYELGPQNPPASISLQGKRQGSMNGRSDRLNF